MILTEQQIETIQVAYEEWLKAVESSLPKEMMRRAQVSKEMKDLLEEVNLFHGGSFNSEQLCRSIKIQRKVHNLNPIALPKFLGYFQYSRYFKGFKGSDEEFKEQHPKLQVPGESGLGYPGVDLKDFSESLRQLLIFEGDDFASSAEKVISFQGLFHHYLFFAIIQAQSSWYKTSISRKRYLLSSPFTSSTWSSRIPERMSHPPGCRR